MSWVAAAVVGGAVIGGVASNAAAKTQSKSAKDAANISASSAANDLALQRQMYDQTREDQTPWRDTGAGALNQLAALTGVGPGFATGKYERAPVTAANFDAEAYLRANPDVAAHPVFGQDPYLHYTRHGINENRRQELPTFDKAGGEGAPGAYGSLIDPFGMSDFEADPGYAFRQSEGNKMLERSAAARGGLLSGSAIKAGQRFGQDLASQEYGNAYNRFQSNQNNQFNRLASLAGVGQTANNALQQAGSQFANAATGIGQANAANQGNALMSAGNARASGYAGIGNAISGAVQGWPQQQAGYQVPQGYSMGSGYLGNALATSQGYQPLNHAAANAGYYDN